MRTDAFETHIRTHGVEGPRGVMPSPGSYARIRMCPCCRFMFDRDHGEALGIQVERDHGEALGMNRGKLPAEFDAGVIEAMYCVDRIGPDDTQPPVDEAGFEVVP